MAYDLPYYDTAILSILKVLKVFLVIGYLEGRLTYLLSSIVYIYIFSRTIKQA
jgi:hypothetical protein